jgi:zinc protease
LGQIKSAVAFSRDGSFATAAVLNEAIAMGDWTYFTTYLDRIAKVTTADIQRVAQTYLVEDQSTTGWFVPKTGGGVGASTGPTAAKLQPGGPYYLSRILSTVDSGTPLPGVHLYTKSMAVADVVTIGGNFRAGDVYNHEKKCAIAQMTAAMLDKGTATRDKFEIADLLESVGAKMAFTSDDFRVNFSIRCLKDDLNLVLELLAEQLRTPAFDEADLATLQTRLVANLQRVQESTDEMAKIRFSQLIYPGNHPNYAIDIEDEIAAVKSITRDQLKEFYEAHYGLGSMLIAAAGDINRTDLESYLTACFKGWTDAHTTAPESTWSPPRQPRHAAESVHIAEKTSVDLILGCSIGIDLEHADFIPLHVGNFILGGNFAARLMGAVRDEQGLTYSISSYLGGANDGKEGFWVTQGSYAPELVDKGRAATMEQIEKWVEAGITEEELSAKQTTIIGTAQVGLANTSGMTNVILDLVKRDLPPTYLSEYLEQVAALEVAEVNQVIRKYIDPAKLCEVAAGTLDD